MIITIINEITIYKKLLKDGFVVPTELDIFICDADGSNLRQLTYLGNANWSPFFHPSGEKSLFSSPCSLVNRSVK